MSRTTPLPETLPEGAKGYTKCLGMHLNYGSDGGAATYSIHDENGEIMPFGYAYRSGSRTKSENYAGFIAPGHESKALSWPELQALWPEILSAQLKTKATP